MSAILGTEQARHAGCQASRRQRGTALVEFALVFPFLLVLTLTVVDMSRAFWVKNVVHQAAREGVRYLVVHSVADSTGVRARVQEVVEPTKATLKTLTITGPATGKVMTVTVGAEFNWLYPGLFSWLGASFTNPVTLSGKAAMRKEG